MPTETMEHAKKFKKHHQCKHKYTYTKITVERQQQLTAMAMNEGRVKGKNVKKRKTRRVKIKLTMTSRRKLQNGNKIYLTGTIYRVYVAIQGGYNAMRRLDTGILMPLYTPISLFI